MNSLSYYLKKFKNKEYEEFNSFYDLTSDYIYLYLFITLNDYESINRLFFTIYVDILKKSKKFLKKDEILLNILNYTRKTILKNLKKDFDNMEFVYKKNQTIEKDEDLILMRLKSILSLQEKEYILFKEYFKLNQEILKKMFSSDLENLNWIGTEIMIKIKSKIDMLNNQDIVEIFINQIKDIKIPNISQNILEGV